jgi:hypothetical protein
MTTKKISETVKLPWADIQVVYPRTFDLDKLMATLDGRIKNLDKVYRAKCTLLANKDYIKNAPPGVVQRTRDSAILDGRNVLNAMDHQLRLAYLKIKELDG